MNSMVKKIFLIVAVVLCCGAVVVGGAWCSAQNDDSPCQVVDIVADQIFACNAYSGLALYMDRCHRHDQGDEYRSRIYPKEGIRICAFCNKQSDRRAAVHFSADTGLY